MTLFKKKVLINKWINYHFLFTQCRCSKGSVLIPILFRLNTNKFFSTHSSIICSYGEVIHALMVYTRWNLNATNIFINKWRLFTLLLLNQVFPGFSSKTLRGSTWDTLLKKRMMLEIYLPNTLYMRVGINISTLVSALRALLH